jgi:hypothetical protein
MAWQLLFPGWAISRSAGGYSTHLYATTRVTIPTCMLHLGLPYPLVCYNLGYHTHLYVTLRLPYPLVCYNLGYPTHSYVTTWVTLPTCMLHSGYPTHLYVTTWVTLPTCMLQLGLPYPLVCYTPVTLPTCMLQLGLPYPLVGYFGSQQFSSTVLGQRWALGMYISWRTQQCNTLFYLVICLSLNLVPSPNP